MCCGFSSPDNVVTPESKIIYAWQTLVAPLWTEPQIVQVVKANFNQAPLPMIQLLKTSTSIAVFQQQKLWLKKEDVVLTVTLRREKLIYVASKCSQYIALNAT